MIEAPRLLPVPAAPHDPELVDGTERAGVGITGGGVGVEPVDVAASPAGASTGST